MVTIETTNKEDFYQIREVTHGHFVAISIGEPKYECMLLPKNNGSQASTCPQEEKEMMEMFSKLENPVFKPFGEQWHTELLPFVSEYVLVLPFWL